MEDYKLKFKPLGSIALLIVWPDEICRDILRDICFFRSHIESELADIVVDTVPSYNSLAIFFDTGKIKYKAIVKKVKEAYKLVKKDDVKDRRLWNIPVCYDEKFGIDLEELSVSKNISKEEIIAIHSKNIYDVYLVGFLPGFIYLGSLPKEIQQSRRSEPRVKILKGAVGIAGEQTGIYPEESPGGWNIIGNSPIKFFDPKHDPPCFAKSGDQIQFIPVNIKEYKEITKLVRSGKYLMESKKI